MAQAFFDSFSGSVKQFSDQQKLAVWQKARLALGYNPAYVRLDACGAYIQWRDYGNTNSKFGWEIDHIVPVSASGGDNLDNLQPLQWENNRAKGNLTRLVCVVRT